MSLGMHNRRKYVIATLVSLIIWTTGSDNFCSTVHLRQLRTDQQQLLPKIKEYLSTEITRLQLLGLLIEKTELHLKEANVAHPIDAYHLINNWFNIAETINDSSSLTGHVSVSKKDITGALKALLRIQRTYNLSAKSLSQGKIHNSASKPLGPKDCYRLGLEAKNSGDYSLALEWLQMALQFPEDAIFKNDIIIKLAEIHFLIGDYDQAVTISEELIKNADENKVYLKKIQFFQMVHRNNNKNNNSNNNSNSNKNKKITHLDVMARDKWKRNVTEEHLQYETLCRDDLKGNFQMKPQTLCRIRNPTSYYYSYKEEIHSFDPWVSVMYDVITDKEAEILKDMAIHDLKRSILEDGYTAERRVSKTSWLWDHFPSNSIVPKVSKRIKYITGLSTTIRPRNSSAEPLQIVNYGMGGHFELHVDTLKDIGPDEYPDIYKYTGDRIATFMIYLNDVEAGGHTVFPRINISLKPIKNAAVFWYNMKRSGEYDDRSLHAGCPVLLGEKWIANKWIREFGQEFRRPCGTSINATDEELAGVWQNMFKH